MSNRLKMADLEKIEALQRLGWSRRRIARELGLDRATVRRHLDSSGAKAAISLTGSVPGFGPGSPPDADVAAESKAAISLAGVDALAKASAHSAAAPSIVKAGRQNGCAPFDVAIKEGLAAGLTAQRIFQDLRADRGFAGGYSAVQRYVRALGAATPLPFRRMEVLPGTEAQIDFGQGAPTARPDRQARRRPHLLRVVLSHSRKAYSETAWRQATDELIRVLENAFQHFGGVPATLVVDNLKAAVLEADWFDPTITPKFQAFARHCGFVVLPTKPYTPEHKGKVEAGVKYVQQNAVAGRTFDSLTAHNEHLLHWERTIADLRVHGTTRRQVRDVFEQHERAALQPLPAERFPLYEEELRKVHLDGHVIVRRAYYSAPPEFVGHTVWARFDGRLVRLFDRQERQLAVHAAVPAGKFSTLSAHVPDAKISGAERGAAHYLEKARRVGPKTAAWAEGVLAAKGLHGIRLLQGLAALAHRVEWKALEHAAELATSHGAWRLKTLRSLTAEPDGGERQLAFLETHPVIRDTAEYAEFARDAFAETPTVEGSVIA